MIIEMTIDEFDEVDYLHIIIQGISLILPELMIHDPSPDFMNQERYFLIPNIESCNILMEDLRLILRRERMEVILKVILDCLSVVVGSSW